MAVQFSIEIDGHLAGDVHQSNFLCLNISVGIQGRDLALFLLAPDQHLFLPAHDDRFADDVERPCKSENAVGAVNSVQSAVKNSFAAMEATGDGEKYVPMLSDFIAGLNGLPPTD